MAWRALRGGAGARGSDSGSAGRFQRSVVRDAADPAAASGRQTSPAAHPAPANELEGPCGIAVDNAGRVYVSDYYHDTIDLFGADIGPGYSYGYISQIVNVDPLDGPCALALDGAGNLYANDFHRSAIGFTPPTVFAGAPKEAGVHPTGLAVDRVSERLYVNERDHLAVFDLTGAEVGQLGVGSLGDGYGLAVSRFGTTAGYVYVPDAADDTLEVYAPAALPGDPPIATIDGSVDAARSLRLPARRRGRGR